MKFIQSITIEDHENWNAEEKILLYVPTINASKGVADGNYNRHFNIEIIQKCTIAAHQSLPSEATRTRTRRKNYFPTFQVSASRKVLEM